MNMWHIWIETEGESSILCTVNGHVYPCVLRPLFTVAVDWPRRYMQTLSHTASALIYVTALHHLDLCSLWVVMLSRNLPLVHPDRGPRNIRKTWTFQLFSGS